MEASVPKVSGCGNTKSQPKVPNACINWCFTLNNYCSEDITAIIKVCCAEKAKYVFQEETGEQGTPHLQGCIKFARRLRPLSLGLNKGIHWTATRNWKASVAYCQKKETRTGKVYTNIEIEKDLFEILAEARVEEEKKIKRKLYGKWYGWQLKVIGMCLIPPIERKVHWLWSTEGGIGKSSIADYLTLKYGAITVNGERKDIHQGVVRYIQMHKRFCETFIVDIARSDGGHTNYGAIEDLKNMRFMSGKYEGADIIGPKPRVFVFANSPPLIGKLSKDRLDVFRIKKRKKGKFKLERTRM